VSKLDSRYQCPRCSQSYVENDGRFCLKFSRKLSEEEQKEADFIFHRRGFCLTRECKWVYRGWNWNCAGFKEEK
jgi:hypothetical protein